MANTPATLSSLRTVTLASGHTLEVNPGGSTLQVSNPEGRVELTVRCTAEGCVLDFSTTNLQLSAAGKVSLECEEFALKTQHTLELSSDGDLISRVGGASVTQVQGRSETRAAELELVATRGDAAVRANDHVRLVGEQILLNSEHPKQTQDELEAFWKHFGM